MNELLWQLFLDGTLNCYDVVAFGMTEAEFERRFNRRIEWNWSDAALIWAEDTMQ
jgi:hypothetical protein